MKRDRKIDEKFTWDMTAIILRVMVIEVVLALIGAFAPFGHAT
jgi:hypothetical protein